MSVSNVLTAVAILIAQLGQHKPRLLCSLVHKFGRKGVDNFEAYIKELKCQPCHTVGELFVFVAECHRTQGGKMHQTIKALMPNPVFIGFTGMPLLKKDKQTSFEVFGSYTFGDNGCCLSSLMRTKFLV